ncbi:hypothetical protein CYMTET_2940 [Cymbomonas tetramitiformis]|uniref:Uncharacterized protein n=1 Tax=Cymbomonas tetramitiformis TaxID=36881 RepID=A0AAE0LLC1_9CHLO|nr:hypothetical protein CYMTET_2940 [Cymbomonas tetramitiformis]
MAPRTSGRGASSAVDALAAYLDRHETANSADSKSLKPNANYVPKRNYDRDASPPLSPDPALQPRSPLRASAVPRSISQSSNSTESWAGFHTGADVDRPREGHSGRLGASNKQQAAASTRAHATSSPGATSVGDSTLMSLSPTTVSPGSIHLSRGDRRSDPTAQDPRQLRHPPPQRTLCSTDPASNDGPRQHGRGGKPSVSQSHRSAEEAGWGGKPLVDVLRTHVKAALQAAEPFSASDEEVPAADPHRPREASGNGFSHSPEFDGGATAARRRGATPTAVSDRLILMEQRVREMLAARQRGRAPGAGCWAPAPAKAGDSGGAPGGASGAPAPTQRGATHAPAKTSADSATYLPERLFPAAPTALVDKWFGTQKLGPPGSATEVTLRSPNSETLHGASTSPTFSIVQSTAYTTDTSVLTRREPTLPLDVGQATPDGASTPPSASIGRLRRNHPASPADPPQRPLSPGGTTSDVVSTSMLSVLHDALSGSSNSDAVDNTHRSCNSSRGTEAAPVPASRRELFTSQPKAGGRTSPRPRRNRAEQRGDSGPPQAPGPPPRSQRHSRSESVGVLDKAQHSSARPRPEEPPVRWRSRSQGARSRATATSASGGHGSGGAGGLSGREVGAASHPSSAGEEAKVVRKLRHLYTEFRDGLAEARGTPVHKRSRAAPKPLETDEYDTTPAVPGPTRSRGPSSRRERPPTGSAVPGRPGRERRERPHGAAGSLHGDGHKGESSPARTVLRSRKGIAAAAVKSSRISSRGGSLRGEEKGHLHKPGRQQAWTKSRRAAELGKKKVAEKGRAAPAAGAARRRGGVVVDGLGWVEAETEEDAGESSMLSGASTNTHNVDTGAEASVLSSRVSESDVSGVTGVRALHEDGMEGEDEWESPSAVLPKPVAGHKATPRARRARELAREQQALSTVAELFRTVEQACTWPEESGNEGRPSRQHAAWREAASGDGRRAGEPRAAWREEPDSTTAQPGARGKGLGGRTDAAPPTMRHVAEPGPEQSAAPRRPGEGAAAMLGEGTEEERFNRVRRILGIPLHAKRLPTSSPPGISAAAAFSAKMSDPAPAPPEVDAPDGMQWAPREAPLWEPPEPPMRMPPERTEPGVSRRGSHQVGGGGEHPPLGAADADRAHEGPSGRAFAARGPLAVTLVELDHVASTAESLLADGARRRAAEAAVASAEEAPAGGAGSAARAAPTPDAAQADSTGRLDAASIRSMYPNLFGQVAGVHRGPWSQPGEAPPAPPDIASGASAAWGGAAASSAASAGPWNRPDVPTWQVVPLPGPAALAGALVPSDPLNTVPMPTSHQQSEGPPTTPQYTHPANSHAPSASQGPPSPQPAQPSSYSVPISKHPPMWDASAQAPRYPPPTDPRLAQPPLPARPHSAVSRRQDMQPPAASPVFPPMPPTPHHLPQPHHIHQRALASQLAPQYNPTAQAADGPYPPPRAPGSHVPPPGAQPPPSEPPIQPVLPHSGHPPMPGQEILAPHHQTATPVTKDRGSVVAPPPLSSYPYGAEAASAAPMGVDAFSAQQAPHPQAYPPQHIPEQHSFGSSMASGIPHRHGYPVTAGRQHPHPPPGGQHPGQDPHPSTAPYAPAGRPATAHEEGSASQLHFTVARQQPDMTPNSAPPSPRHPPVAPQAAVHPHAGVQAPSPVPTSAAYHHLTAAGPHKYELQPGSGYPQYPLHATPLDQEQPARDAGVMHPSSGSHGMTLQSSQPHPEATQTSPALQRGDYRTRPGHRYVATDHGASASQERAVTLQPPAPSVESPVASYYSSATPPQTQSAVKPSTPTSHYSSSKDQRTQQQPNPALLLALDRPRPNISAPVRSSSQKITILLA